MLYLFFWPSGLFVVKKNGEEKNKNMCVKSSNGNIQNKRKHGEPFGHWTHMFINSFNTVLDLREPSHSLQISNILIIGIYLIHRTPTADIHIYGNGNSNSKR